MIEFLENATSAIIKSIKYVITHKIHSLCILKILRPASTIDTVNAIVPRTAI